MIKTEISKSLIDCFLDDFPVLTFEALKTKSGCESRTLQRKIKLCNLLVSYNKNAKFYTTSSMAHFNEYGIWNYKQILFSKYGNLFETIIKLIDNSINGYSANELSVIIEVKSDDALRILWQKQRICRQKTGSNNVYFSLREDLFAQQLQIRQQLIQVAPISAILLDYQITIAILVEIIQQDSLDASSIVKAVKRRKIEITKTEVQTVIEHYQLKKKKVKS